MKTMQSCHLLLPSDTGRRLAVSAALLLLLVISLLTIPTARAFAQNSPPDQAMRTAEQLYARGEFALAAQSYQQLVDQGYADPVIFYNMGQAYWQNGDLGRALWSLRSAQSLDPRDPEIAAALAAVRAQLVGAQPAAADANPVTLATRWSAGLFSLDDLAWLALGLWSLFAALMLLFVLRAPFRKTRRVARVASPVVGVLLIVTVLALGSRLRLYNDVVEAVVVAPQVEISNGPGPEFGVQFALPGGAEVELVETRGDWVRIVEMGNGATGWAPREAVATVQPTGKG